MARLSACMCHLWVCTSVPQIAAWALCSFLQRKCFGCCLRTSRDFVRVCFVADRSLLVSSLRVFVSCRRVSWLSADGSGGFEVPYPAIALHAVCKDLSTFPEPCIFCQLVSPAGMDDDDDDMAMPDSAIPLNAEAAAAMAAAESGPAPEGGAAATAAVSGAGGAVAAQRRRTDGGASSGVAAGVDVRRAGELRFAPSGASLAAPATVDSVLDSMFAAMSACAELHPDPMAEDGGDDDDDDGGMMGFGGGMISFASMMRGGSGGAGAADVAAASAGSGSAGGAANEPFVVLGPAGGGGGGAGGIFSADAAGAAGVDFASGGWVGDAAALAQMGLPVAIDAAAVMAAMDGADGAAAADDAAEP